MFFLDAWLKKEKKKRGNRKSDRERGREFCDKIVLASAEILSLLVYLIFSKCFMKTHLTVHNPLSIELELRGS